MDSGAGNALDADVALKVAALFQRSKSRAAVTFQQHVRDLTYERLSRHGPQESRKRAASLPDSPAPAPKAIGF